jgi:hypothetical protein
LYRRAGSGHNADWGPSFSSAKFKKLRAGYQVRNDNVPGGFEIVEGQTDYEVELGKSWKP